MNKERKNENREISNIQYPIFKDVGTCAPGELSVQTPMEQWEGSCNGYPLSTGPPGRARGPGKYIPGQPDSLRENVKKNKSINHPYLIINKIQSFTKINLLS